MFKIRYQCIRELNEEQTEREAEQLTALRRTQRGQQMATIDCWTDRTGQGRAGQGGGYRDARERVDPALQRNANSVV